MDEASSFFRTLELLTNTHLDHSLCPVRHALVPNRVPSSHVRLSRDEMKDLLLTIYSFTCTMENTTRFKYIFHTHFIEF